VLDVGVRFSIPLAGSGLFWLGRWCISILGWLKGAALSPRSIAGEQDAVADNRGKSELLNLVAALRETINGVTIVERIGEPAVICRPNPVCGMIVEVNLRRPLAGKTRRLAICEELVQQAMLDEKSFGVRIVGDAPMFVGSSGDGCHGANRPGPSLATAGTATVERKVGVVFPEPLNGRQLDVMMG
jgi:hypothetical protein